MGTELTTQSAYTSEICRLLVLIVLASAAWGKLVNIGQFAKSLTDDFYVPSLLSKKIAFAVAGFEWIAFALTIAGGLWSRIGVSLAMLLFAVFSAVLLEAIVRRRRVFCNCFGRSKYPISSVDLVRNSTYIAACAFYLLNTTSVIPSGWLIQLSLVLAAVLCFLISNSLHEIRNLMR